MTYGSAVIERNTQRCLERQVAQLSSNANSSATRANFALPATKLATRGRNSSRAALRVAPRVAEKANLQSTKTKSSLLLCRFRLEFCWRPKRAVQTRVGANSALPKLNLRSQSAFWSLLRAIVNWSKLTQTNMQISSGERAIEESAKRKLLPFVFSENEVCRFSVFLLRVATKSKFARRQAKQIAIEFWLPQTRRLTSLRVAFAVGGRSSSSGEVRRKSAAIVALSLRASRGPTLTFVVTQRLETANSQHKPLCD